MSAINFFVTKKSFSKHRTVPHKWQWRFITTIVLLFLYISIVSSTCVYVRTYSGVGMYEYFVSVFLKKKKMKLLIPMCVSERRISKINRLFLAPTTNAPPTVSSKIRNAKTFCFTNKRDLK